MSPKDFKMKRTLVMARAPIRFEELLYIARGVTETDSFLLVDLIWPVRSLQLKARVKISFARIHGIYHLWSASRIATPWYSGVAPCSSAVVECTGRWAEGCRECQSEACRTTVTQKCKMNSPSSRSDGEVVTARWQAIRGTN